MIRLEPIRVLLTRVELKFDKHGSPFLKCKGSTKGIEKIEEKQAIERVGIENKQFITGVNYFANISIYGEMEELDKLQQHYQERMDAINKQREATGKKIPRIIKVVLSSDTYLRNYLINGMLLSCLYSFNFKFGQRLTKSKLKLDKEPQPIGRPKLTEKEKAKREQKKIEKITIKEKSRYERVKEQKSESAKQIKKAQADKKLEKDLQKIEKATEDHNVFDFDFLNELETFEKD